MKVFITGIAGFIGSHVGDYLREKGHDVCGCDNLIGGDAKNFEGFWVKDCRDYEHMLALLSGSQYDALIHCACTPHEGLSVFSPLYVSRNTFDASVCVFTAAIKAGIRRIVNVSSMARYGNQGVPYQEDMDPKPCDPYGISKVAAEQVLSIMAQTHGVEPVTLVPHNVIGPRQRYWDPYRNVAAIMTNRMLQGKPPILYGEGKSRRVFSDIRDIVPCFEAALKLGVSWGQHPIINVGPYKPAVTIHDLATKLAALCGYTGEFMSRPRRPQEVKSAWCETKKMRTLLGVDSHYSLDESLAVLVEWIRAECPREFDYHLPLEIPNYVTPLPWVEREM